MTHPYGLVCRAARPTDATPLIVICLAKLDEIVPAIDAGRVLVAEHPQEGLVGYVQFSQRNGDGLIEMVFVAEFHRRAGFGKALLETLGEAGRRRGWGQVWASLPASASANLFFEGIGWQPGGITSRGVRLWHHTLEEDLHG